MKTNLKISKVNYSGNGFTNNLGYSVSNESESFKVFIHAANNVKYYDEAYDAKEIDNGIHLYNEASEALKNVFTNGNDTLESYFEYCHESELETLKMASEISDNEKNEDYSNE